MKKLLLITVFIILFNSLYLAGKGRTRMSDPISKSWQDLTPPEFPGGEEAFHQYLNTNIKWPKSTKIHGTVIISFTVEKTGYLSDFKIVKSVEQNFDAEALRVVKKSPRWIPAMRNRKPIKSVYSVPIKYFTIED